LVTGAAGSIGSEIVRQLCGFEINKLILCDIAETPLHDITLELKEKFPNIDFVAEISDVRSQQVMRNIFEKYSPQYIYHAAAYKHVPMMEIHPKEAVRTNVFGTKIVADLAVEFKVESFVLVSTDKAVNPSSVMGASTRAAEISVRIHSQRFAGQENQTRFIITRFGNVLGSSGSVVPLFAKQIRQGGPITVTHPDIIRYFMTIPEACSLVLEAGNLGKGGEIFVFDMGEPIRIKDMAEEMIKFSGLIPHRDIKIEYTGLRQGEKLYEEILYDNDKVNSCTENKKIMIGTVRYHKEEIVLPRYDALLELCKTGDNLSVVQKIKEIVPEFISKNSEYEVLNKTKN
jgi:FlaA1/EpsC-like NDP-sugar epimerase